MFAENRMDGKTIVKIDENGKILIPKETGAEVGECLSIELVKDSVDNYLKFHNTNRVLKVIKNAEKALNNAKTKEEYDQINNEIALLIEKYILSTEIDSENRLLINEDLLRKMPECEEYELEYKGYTASFRGIRKRG